MALSSKIDDRQENALLFGVHPNDPLYDIMYELSESGVKAHVRPDGGLSLRGGTKEQRDHISSMMRGDSNAGLRSRVKNWVQHPSAEDRAKYYYQEYAYPATPWWAFTDPKATTVDRALTVAAPAMEFANPAAGAIGRRIEGGATRGAENILSKLMTNEPLKKGLARGVGRLAPEAARAATLGGIGATAGALSKDSTAAGGLEEAGEFELARGALKAPAGAARFLNRASGYSRDFVAKTLPAAMNILHSGAFEKYFKTEAPKWAGNWLGVLSQMSWDQFHDIFGKRFSNDMDGVADEIVERSRYNLSRAEADFNRQFNIKPGQPVAQGQWNVQMQRAYNGTVGAAQKQLADAQKQLPVVKKLIDGVVNLNNQIRFDDEGQMKQGQRTLGELKANTKSAIRGILGRFAPDLPEQYDQVNHDFEQAISLTKFAKQDGWKTPAGDVNTAWVQGQLTSRGDYLRKKFGEFEFQDLNKAVRRGAPESTGEDRPGVLRRRSGLGHFNIGGGGLPRAAGRLLLPTREFPNKSNWIGQQLRNSPGLASRAAFSLLDPKILQGLTLLNPNAPDKQGPKGP